MFPDVTKLTIPDPILSENPLPSRDERSVDTAAVAAAKSDSITPVPVTNDPIRVASPADIDVRISMSYLTEIAADTPPAITPTITLSRTEPTVVSRPIIASFTIEDAPLTIPPTIPPMMISQHSPSSSTRFSGLLSQ